MSCNHSKLLLNNNLPASVTITLSDYNTPVGALFYCSYCEKPINFGDVPAVDDFFSSVVTYKNTLEESTMWERISGKPLFSLNFIREMLDKVWKKALFVADLLSGFSIRIAIYNSGHLIIGTNYMYPISVRITS